MTPDEDRTGKIIRAIGAAILAVVAFGFRNDVENWWFRALLGTLGILALIWGVFPFLRRTK